MSLIVPNLRPETAAHLRNHLILIRHAQSVGNVDIAHYSRYPFTQLPLSEEGMRQADLVGKSITLPAQYVLATSGFVRANDTGEHMGLMDSAARLFMDERFGEIDFRQYENRASRIKMALYDVFFAEEKALQGKLRCFRTSPAGETPLCVTRRLVPALTELVSLSKVNDESKPIILVGHGISNLLIRMLVEGRDTAFYETEEMPNNASVFCLKTQTYLHPGFT